MLGPASPAHEHYERGFRAEAERLGLMQRGVLDILDAGTRVPELLPAFDLLALSSVPRSEGMPTVILEAMASGLPVVATNVGAVAEEVVDGETGLIVPPLDEDAFAGALVRLATDAELRARMGAAGRERFEQSFRLDVLADVHVQAFELAREHRRSRRDTIL
jgi:glycosyltransferase involved in cell wall biosynthesis